MSQASIDPRYLEVFPQWLRSLGEDAGAVGELLATDDASDEAARSLVTGLNYIFKSLDLIPDGIDDLGLLDDAFVLRVACGFAIEARPEAKKGVVQRLGDDVRAVKDFLGDDYPRLEAYVKALRKGAARGRTVEEIVTDAQIRGQFLQEVRAWAAGYQVPSFTRDQKTLVKLKSFLSAKLPTSPRWGAAGLRALRPLLRARAGSQAGSPSRCSGGVGAHLRGTSRPRPPLRDGEPARLPALFARWGYGRQRRPVARDGRGDAGHNEMCMTVGYYPSGGERRLPPAKAVVPSLQGRHRVGSGRHRFNLRRAPAVQDVLGLLDAVSRSSTFGQHRAVAPRHAPGWDTTRPTRLWAQGAQSAEAADDRLVAHGSCHYDTERAVRSGDHRGLL